jgi:hypothetical protein
MRTKKPNLDPTVPERRSFLKTLGFTGGAAFLGSAVTSRVGGTNVVSASGSIDTARRPMILLNSSDGHSPDNEFIKICEAVMSSASAAGARRGLDSTVARLCHPFQVYLRDVREADAWLGENGYLRSLDYYVANGGRQVALFHQLDRVSEPQYGICRKSLAYVSFALRRRYSSRRVQTMFPGPSERLGSGGFYRYFEHYDLLANHRLPRTFSQVFGKNVDPLIQHRTMLNHGSRGVFDSVALCYESGSPIGSSASGVDGIGTIHYLKWFKESVDDSVLLYQSEQADAGKCRVKKATREWESYATGRGLLPYEYGCSHYYFHVVA